MYDKLLKHKWYTNRKYLFTTIRKRLYYAHWLVAGKPKKPFVTDHLDRNTFNTRRSNLLNVRPHINSRNCKKYDPEESYRLFPFHDEAEKEMFHKYYVRGERDNG